MAVATAIGPASGTDAGGPEREIALKYDLSAGRRIVYRMAREVRSTPEGGAEAVAGTGAGTGAGAGAGGGPGAGAGTGTGEATERVFSEETVLDLLVARREKDGTVRIEARRRSVSVGMPCVERFPVSETAPVRRETVTASIRQAVEDFLAGEAETWRMDELGRIETDADTGAAATGAARKAHRTARWKRRTVEDLAGAWRDTANICPPLPIWPVFPGGGGRPGIMMKYRRPQEMATTGGTAAEAAEGRSGILEIEAEWKPGPAETGGPAGRRRVSGPLRLIPRVAVERFLVPLPDGKAAGRVAACESLPGRLVWDMADGWPELIEGGFRATVEYSMGNACLSRTVTVRVKVERIRQAP
ncbi:MAG: hypothetical protein N3A38_04805 [Planctomycetota bacterium]|nr:hypothetical protein [Planctomycetota bacterium]